MSLHQIIVGYESLSQKLGTCDRGDLSQPCKGEQEQQMHKGGFLPLYGLRFWSDV